MAKLVVSLIFFVMYNSVYAAVHDQKTIEVVQSSAKHECIYFKLKDVSIADSSVSNEPWFAVPATNAMKNDILSLAMIAYSTDALVRVTTTGERVCGSYAGVSYFRLVK